MSEQVLKRANIVTVLKQMRRKRMTQSVRAGVFRNAAFSQCRLERFLQTRGRNVMSAL